MIFVDGLGAPETPRLRADGSWMCVEMTPDRGCVTHISADGKNIRQIAKTGCPNGLCISADGVAWVAETHPHPSLMRVTLEGDARVFMDSAGDKPFLLPNDLCFSEAGLLYMTYFGIPMPDWAPGGSLRADWATAPFDGRVYEIDLRKKSCRVIDAGYRFTNGIAFGPDGHLYVNEMITGDVFRYRFSGGRLTGAREHFCNVLAPNWPGGFRGPDGMAFSRDGRLWCSVYGEATVAVIDPTGAIISRLKTDGTAPTNVAFGANGERQLYVSDHQKGRIEVFDVDAEALPLNPGPSGV